MHTLTEQLRKALRAVRTGRIDQLRFLHLIGKEDNGTASDPLRALSSMSRHDAHVAVAEAFSRLTHAISVAIPTVSPQATPFLIKFQKVIVRAILDDVAIKTISKWVAAVLHLVSQSRRQYSFGEGGASLPRFEIDFIETNSEERIELERATQDERAKRAAASVVGKGGPHKDTTTVDKRGRQAPDPTSKTQLKKAKLAVKKAASATAADDGADDKHGPGVDPNGAKVPNPVKNPAHKDKDAQQRAWDAFNALHPKPDAKGKNVCWDWWHPQGCTEKQCKYLHC